MSNLEPTQTHSPLTDLAGSEGDVLPLLSRRVAFVLQALVVAAVVAVIVVNPAESRRSEAAAAAAEQGWAYLGGHVGPGAPRWDPCREIRWAMADPDAPPSALPRLHRGFENLSTATGLRFTFVGVRSDPVRLEGDDPLPDGVDVYVGFAPESESPALAEQDTIAKALVAHEVSMTGRRRYKNAKVLFEVERRSQYPPRFATFHADAVVAHELGHVAGLGHPDRRDVIMSARIGSWSPAAYTEADLAGLVALGGRCER